MIWLDHSSSGIVNQYEEVKYIEQNIIWEVLGTVLEIQDERLKMRTCLK